MLSIRTAGPPDLPAICTLSDQINRQHWHMHADVFVDPDRYDAQTDGAAARVAQSSAFWLEHLEAADSTLLVAKLADSVVGFITAKILPVTAIPFLAARQVCRIGTIVIDTSAQQRGVGSALMAAAEAWARQRDVVEMRLEVFDFNHDAMRFYDNVGFAVQSHIMIKALR